MGINLASHTAGREDIQGRCPCCFGCEYTQLARIQDEYVLNDVRARYSGRSATNDKKPQKDGTKDGELVVMDSWAR